MSSLSRKRKEEFDDDYHDSLGLTNTPIGGGSVSSLQLTNLTENALIKYVQDVMTMYGVTPSSTKLLAVSHLAYIMVVKQLPIPLQFLNDGIEAVKFHTKDSPKHSIRVNDIVENWRLNCERMSEINESIAMKKLKGGEEDAAKIAAESDPLPDAVSGDDDSMTQKKKKNKKKTSKKDKEAAEEQAMSAVKDTPELAELKLSNPELYRICKQKELFSASIEQKAKAVDVGMMVLSLKQGTHSGETFEPCVMSAARKVHCLQKQAYLTLVASLEKLPKSTPRAVLLSVKVGVDAAKKIVNEIENTSGYQTRLERHLGVVPAFQILYDQLMLVNKSDFEREPVLILNSVFTWIPKGVDSLVQDLHELLRQINSSKMSDMDTEMFLGLVLRGLELSKCDTCTTIAEDMVRLRTGRNAENDVPEVLSTIEKTIKFVSERVNYYRSKGLIGKTAGENVGGADMVQQPNIKCWKCGITGHFSANCPSKTSKPSKAILPSKTKKKEVVCSYCHKTGHLAKRCFAKLKAERKKNEQEQKRQQGGGGGGEGKSGLKKS
jgi:hypothetical protein